MLHTFELDGTQNDSLAVTSGPQVSCLTPCATKPTAGRVRFGAYQDLALDVHGLIGSQELEGLKCETGIGTFAIVEGPKGVVHGTSKNGKDSVNGLHK